jgi:hypothetical protein
LYPAFVFLCSIFKQIVLASSAGSVAAEMKKRPQNSVGFSRRGHFAGLVAYPHCREITVCCCFTRTNRERGEKKIHRTTLEAAEIMVETVVRLLHIHFANHIQAVCGIAVDEVVSLAS